MARAQAFKLRLSDEEFARLERVAAYLGANLAVAIRMLLMAKDREIDLEKRQARIGVAERSAAGHGRLGVVQ